MSDAEKNLTDLPKDINASYQTSLLRALPYGKTDKLVMALYMVTDIIDNQEPIRNKLRTLGVEILSDTTSGTKLNLARNIQAILSFLDIAFTMNMISEMNKNILANEFTKLKNSFVIPQDNPIWLEEFLKEDPASAVILQKGSNNRSIGHIQSTRIGVQKGSTLMKALRGVEVSDKTTNLSDKVNVLGNFKKERREEIISIIKTNDTSASGITGATITDIKVKAKGPLLSCGEKTLQRELVSMVKDNVLKKTGEKRWSRYFLA
ncbi:hypothetical protein A3G53_00520 [Candidatus Nomurabacteria bacterium RIFCSPLOWO2_12_FULL_44_11]|uniref:Uncharacterized protein n=1 Tax=Candidatus Nomurabacteria bacterium RIFCSPLOWO2_12_FULL_44_11 TaxID=1801796 RepID=A0A1F6Y5C5_9BACT|nr:MAG: hypothetical protein A3G53_00520 [Candidatus Nomurabacteria bacterium RIFCSPLOWO2_12_FULL_44_11]